MHDIGALGHNKDKEYARWKHHTLLLASSCAVLPSTSAFMAAFLNFLCASLELCKGLSAKQGIVPWAELNVRARGTQSKGLLSNAG